MSIFPLVQEQIIKYFFNDETAEKVKYEIQDHSGGEIFFGCKIDENFTVIDAEPICFGTDSEVLAPYEIAKNFNAILHNHPSGNVKPSFQDMQYASYLQNEGIGFFITDNAASKITTVVPPIKLKDKDKIDAEDIEDIFSNNGKISKIKNGYEYRDGQVKMSKKIAEAFNKNKIALLEAGTGIGKSLAYLIPTFLWAEKNNERIVISTNTINLQSQLLNKDIPLVQKILNSTLNAVVIKGRRNYLCKLKLSNIQSEMALDEESEEINSIIKWSAITEKGVLDELNFIPASNVWEKFASETDFCINSNCPYYGECFLQKSRREASESNVIIANHHILFADIEIRKNGRGLEENLLLPPYRKIIFDEAHNIEKSASSFFSYSFSKSGFYKFMGLYRGKNGKGFLPRISSKLAKYNVDDYYDLANFINSEVIGEFSLMYNKSFDIFLQIGQYLKKIITNANVKENSYSLNLSYRIKENDWAGFDFNENFIRPLKNLCEAVRQFSSSFNKIVSRIEDLSDSLRYKIELDYKLAKSYKSKLETYRDNIAQLFSADIREMVTWFDIFGDREDPQFTFSASPLYIDAILNEAVYSVFDSVILTSATITVDNKFDYFKSLSGLSLVKDKEIILESYPSPYDYENRVLVVVPTDIPEPTNYSESRVYNEKLNYFIKKSIEATKGSAFALFTSYNQLKKSYEEVNPYLKDIGLRTFFQGEMEKGKLLDKFKEEIDSNLFATDSFWEGVDAPGDTLRYVVLTKLPFRMPSEPIEEARIEDMERKGINP
ncbi:MAG TPA: helicase C-terminal domain-containing protein, partial [Spirochaetota bacterium]|nr:helicase C-terminal domain-containing protein [Spirochaetota bacterium]